MNDIWRNIKTFYEDNFGISEELVEVMACDNILLLCASGTSNKKISEFLDVDEESVADAIDRYLSTEKISFSGWDISLRVNPFSIYQMVVLLTGCDDYDIYRSEIISLSLDMDEDTLYLSYIISKKYFEIDSTIDKEWK